MNEVGNFVKAVLPRLVGKPAQEALSSLDISLTDKEGNLRDIIQVYTEVAQKIQGIADSERIAVVEGLAGKFHISRMQALLDDLGSVDSMYKRMHESSVNSAGSAIQENEQYMKSLEARSNLARVEIEKLALAVGEAFLTEGMIQGIKVFGDALGVMTRLTETFGSLNLVFGVLGISLAMLSTRFKTLMTSIGITAWGALRGQITLTTTATDAQSVAVGRLSKVWKSALVTTGIGAGMALIGFAIEKVLGDMAKQRELSENLAEENRNLTRSYQDNGDRIDELRYKYASLSKVIESGNYDNEQLKEYTETQNELAQLLPALATGEDEYGNKLLGNESVLNTRISLIKEQIALQKELNFEKEKEESEEKLKLATKELKDATKEITSTLSEARMEFTHSLSGISPDLISYDFGVSSDDFTSIEKIGDALDRVSKSRVEAQKALADMQRSGSGVSNEEIERQQRIIHEYDRFIGVLGGVTESYSSADLKARSAMKTIQLETEKAVQVSINGFTGMSASAREYASSLLSGVIASGKTKESIESIQEVASNLQFNDSLKKSLGEASKAVTDLKKSSVDDFDEMRDKASTVFESLKQDILKSSNLKETSDAYKELNNTLDLSIAKLIGQEQAVRNYASANGISIEAAKLAMLQTGEYDESIDDLNETMRETKDIIDEITGVTQKQIDITEDLIWQYDLLTLQLSTLKEGTDEYNSVNYKLEEVMNSLLTLYPHLISVGKDLENQSQKQVEAIKKETEAYDILRKALKLSKEGKLEAEEAMTLSSALNTKARIEDIRRQIEALKTLSKSHEAVTEMTRKEIFDQMNTGLIPADVGLSMVNALGQYEQLTSKLTDLQDELYSGTNVLGSVIKETEKSTKSATKAEKDAAKAMEESTFIADKYKRAMEELSLEIKKQQDIQSQFPSYSAEHQKALQAELKLQQDKKSLLQEQEKALQAQIKAGKILQTGIVTTKSDSPIALSGFGGKITSQFGMRDGRMHEGIDIASHTGTRQDSNVSGTVTRAEKHKTYGNMVRIEDSSGQTHTYAHLDNIAVRVGQKVAEGMQIGTVGNTGRSKGSHLHYEVRDASGKAINPASYVEEARKGISAASKEVAQVHQQIDAAQAELLSLQGQMMDQEAAVYALETKAIEAQASTFTHRKNMNDKQLENSENKLKKLNSTSAEYREELEKQQEVLGRKLSYNQQEVEFYEELIRTGGLSAVTIADITEKLHKLGLERNAISQASQQAASQKVDSVMGSYDETLEGLEYSLQRSRTIASLLEEGSSTYSSEIKYQIGLLQEQQEEIMNKRNALKNLLQTESLNVEETKKYKKELDNLSLAYWNVSSEVKKLQDATNSFIANSLSKIKDEYISGLKKELDTIVKSIEDSIKVTEKHYDSLIEAQKERLKALDEEIKKEDRLKALREINDEINKVKNDKRFSYITADGEEILTYNKERVSELEKQRDEMLQQYQREDIKQSIQDEISRLEKARQDRIEILRKEIDDTKANYDQRIATEEAKWNELIEAAQKGTLEFDTLMNEFYGSSLTNLQSYVVESISQIEAIKNAYASLATLSVTLPSVSGGGYSGGGSSVPSSSSSSISSNPLGMSDADFNRYVANKQIRETGKDVGGVAKQENQSIRDKYGIELDNYSYKDLKKYHDGGIVGATKTNKLTDLANKLFNAKPGEQVVKSLIGELQIPPKNIPNLFTNIEAMLGSITPNISQLSPATEHHYHFNNMTIKSDSPSEFIRDLKFLISSR